LAPKHRKHHDSSPPARHIYLEKEKATTTAPLLVREGSALSAFQRRFLMNNPTASSSGLVEHLCFE
jgi:hypothetical protein